MGLILFDSTFFVDLDREQRRGVRGPAHGLLLRQGQDEMAMSVITRGELARGFKDCTRWESFCRGFLIIPLDDDILWTAAEQFQRLRQAGTPISDNDLWIGATALARDLPLVSSNVGHFGKMKGLKLLKLEG